LYFHWFRKWTKNFSLLLILDSAIELQSVDLVDEIDKNTNPLSGEVHWVHNVHLVHGLVERAAFNCRF